VKTKRKKTAPDSSASFSLPLEAAGQEMVTATTEVALPVPDEALIADTRAGLTPAQLVELKLITLLKSNPLPISHVQIMATGLNRNRAQ
jgi:hypothetical protein